MGTKVFNESYPLRCYTMRDVNLDSSCNWSFCCEGSRLGGMSCDSSSWTPENGYNEYDKELLRQTMLRHEEIFRKQVCELHRLYRVQRVFMDELKRTGEHSSPVQVHSSQPGPFANKVLAGVTERLWQWNGFPSIDAGRSRAAASGVDHLHTHQSFQNGTETRENAGSHGINGFAGSKVRKSPRQVFDLQLPADAYIDDEDGEDAEERTPIKRLFRDEDSRDAFMGLLPEKTVKLDIGTAQNHSSPYESKNKSGKNVQKDLHWHTLADLNEPLKESDEEAELSSGKLPVQMIHYKEFQGHQKSSKSDLNFIGVQDDYKSEELAFLRGVRGEKGREGLTFRDAIGPPSSHTNSFTLCISNMDVKPSSERPLMEGNRAQDLLSIFSPKKNKTDSSWFTEVPSRGNNKLIDGSHVTNPICSRLTAPSSYSNAGSSLFPPWRKSSSSSSCATQEAEALPCLSEPTTVNIQGRSSSSSSQNLLCACDKWAHKHRPKSTLGSVGAVFLHPDGLPHAFSSTKGQRCSSPSHGNLPSVSFTRTDLIRGAGSACERSEGSGLQRCLKIPIDMDLNLEPSNISQNGTEEEDEEEEEIQLPGEPIKNPNGGPPQKDIALVQGNSELVSYSPMLAWEIGRKIESKDGSCFDLLKSVWKAQNEESSELSGRKILGFPLPQMTQGSSQADRRKNRARASSFTDSSSRCKSLIFEKLTQTDPVLEECAARSSSGFPSATGTDPGKPLERSSEDEARIHLLSVPVIDLEAPPAGAEDKRDGMLLTMAAETIRALSLHGRTSREETLPWLPPPSASSTALHWFAEAVTSGGDDRGSADVDGMDSFELTALKLEKVEVEEPSASRSGREEAAEENPAAPAPADLLLKRSRRGRRWQRRDFQRDILPGLATLSRQEVAEDLQILAAMVRVTGQPWKLGRGRSRARGGRRPPAARSAVRLVAPAAAAAAAAIPLDLPPPRFSGDAEEVSDGGRGVFGWGRTTRRCWRQRCSAAAGELMVAMDG